MAVLPIRKLPDPVLRQKARPVERITRRHRELIKDMKQTLRAAQGAGLAANQVGVLWRIIVVDFDKRCVALINPEITATEGIDVDVEACLSIPEVVGYVERAAVIRGHALNEEGREVTFVATGHLARVIQHEVDHLDGVLFIDRASRLAGPVPTREV